MKVFLSYHKNDSRFSQALTKHLHHHGFTVWDAVTQILPGDNWFGEVSKALKSSRAMIVLLSPDSVRSEWQQREIEFALGEPNYARRLFPVLVRPTREVPWILSKLRILDARLGAEKVSPLIAGAIRLERHTA